MLGKPGQFRIFCASISWVGYVGSLIETGGTQFFHFLRVWKYNSKYIYFDILISIDKTASYTLAVLVTGRQVEWFMSHHISLQKSPQWNDLPNVSLVSEDGIKLRLHKVILISWNAPCLSFDAIPFCPFILPFVSALCFCPLFLPFIPIHLMPFISFMPLQTTPSFV